MNNMVNLDVLVVYSAGIALSASVSDEVSDCPFLVGSKRSNYNLSYAYFLKSCQKLGLSAGFTSSADIIGPGVCRNYWAFLSGKWVKVDKHARSSQVFDKISPVSVVRTVERQLLFSDDSIAPFNDPDLFATFFDKLLTFTELPDYGIPTIAIRSSKLPDIKMAIYRLRVLVAKQRYARDFSLAMVLKDRCGAGGNHVYKIDSDFVIRVSAIMTDNPDVQFILQPFLTFDKGYSYKQNHTSTDLRLIFHHNSLLQCYVRMAQGNDFRCNEHQGGELVYVTAKDIPEKIHAISRKIVSKIGKPQSLYALDFVISNAGRVYFIEGNSRPGIDWDISKKVNEMKSKQLIRSIVTEFSSRIHNSIAQTTLPNGYINLNQAVA